MGGLKWFLVGLVLICMVPLTSVGYSPHNSLGILTTMRISVRWLSATLEIASSPR